MSLDPAAVLTGVDKLLERVGFWGILGGAGWVGMNLLNAVLDSNRHEVIESIGHFFILLIITAMFFRQKRNAKKLDVATSTLNQIRRESRG